jgi:hypothetical protein
MSQPHGDGVDATTRAAAGVVALGLIMSLLDTTIVDVALDPAGRFPVPPRHSRVVLGMCLFGALLVLPQHHQLDRGENALDAACWWRRTSSAPPRAAGRRPARGPHRRAAGARANYRSFAAACACGRFAVPLDRQLDPRTPTCATRTAGPLADAFGHAFRVDGGVVGAGDRRRSCSRAGRGTLRSSRPRRRNAASSFGPSTAPVDNSDHIKRRPEHRLDPKYGAPPRGRRRSRPQSPARTETRSRRARRGGGRGASPWFGSRASSPWRR